MMPGPVSDSYDPEFSTAERAGYVTKAITEVRDKITKNIFGGDATLKDIVQVALGKSGRLHAGPLTEREWRIIRFCMNRALESI